jgi:hypothetical protein
MLTEHDNQPGGNLMFFAAAQLTLLLSAVPPPVVPNQSQADGGSQPPLGSTEIEPFPAYTPDEPSIAHLPEVLRQDITAWRNRLQSAKCLKVVIESDEKWVRLDQLDAEGSGKLVQRERFCIHSWMMTDSLWVVVFPFKDGVADMAHPVLQEYWNASERVVWERVWKPSDEAYHVRRYKWNEKSEPPDAHIAAKGCIYASGTESWLMGDADLSKRMLGVASVALFRAPNLSIVPPDDEEPGVWLDIIKDAPERDIEPKPEYLYRRTDCMLLARNAVGEAEVREWRTIVMTDPKAAGQKPQAITAIQRFTYQFCDAPPTELEATIQTFKHDVDQATGE